MVVKVTTTLSASAEVERREKARREEMVTGERMAIDGAPCDLKVRWILKM